MQALQDRIRVLAGREDRARKALQAVSLERERLEAERAALRLAEQIYRRTLGLDQDSGPAATVTSEGRIRARVGPQRYLMLAALRAAAEPLKLPEIAEASKLGLKRVKDQLAADEQLGVVRSDWDAYAITDVGADLLSRFEAYKRLKGEGLPSAGEASSASDEEEEFE